MQKKLKSMRKRLSKKVKKKILHSQMFRREIICHDCDKVFATRALKSLHTCNSIFDRNISEDGHDRPKHLPKRRTNKKLNQGAIIDGQKRGEQSIEREFIR